MNILSVNSQDFAGLSYNLCTAINELTDHRATNVVLSSTWIQYPMMVAGRRAAMRQVPKLLSDADVLHINEASNLLSHMGCKPEDWKGKQVIYHTHGNRFRRGQLNYLRYLRTHFPGATILVSTPDLLDYVPEASWFPSIVPVEKYHREYERGENTPPIIYNSATKPRMSAPLMKRVVRNLEARGVELEMQTVTRVTHQDNLNRKSKADIYFDGLRVFYGTNAIEAAAFGMPVVCGVYRKCKEHLDTLGMECGFQAFNNGEFDEMRDEVEHLALDKAYRKKVGSDCFEYASEVHSSEAGVKRFMELIE